jgi:hypothetical protein
VDTLLWGGQVSLIILAAVLLFGGVPSQGKATWYGSTQHTSCVGGFIRTCTPYTSGSQSHYCAVGSWRWGDTPYDIFVTSKVTGRTAICTVRDYCEACAKQTGGRVIDLAPAVFVSLGHSLGAGIIRVTLAMQGGR